MRALIIEDNSKTIDYVRQGLKENLFVVDAAYDGEEGLFFAKNNHYDVIILDVMLPGLDGWALVKKIREFNSETPILFLTARDEVDERVKGLELGADDYLVKPFAFSELLARIRTVLRRKSPSSSLELLQVGDLTIDPLKHKASRGDVVFSLTQKEFLLLLLFVQRQGEVLSRTFIAEQVWDMNFDSDTNVVDVAIKRLRDKIDNGFDVKLLHTVRGVGYVLEKR